MKVELPHITSLIFYRSAVMKRSPAIAQADTSFSPPTRLFQQRRFASRLLTRRLPRPQGIQPRLTFECLCRCRAGHAGGERDGARSVRTASPALFCSTPQMCLLTTDGGCTRGGRGWINGAVLCASRWVDNTSSGALWMEPQPSGVRER